jgi:two-component sensor histidine kinase
MRSRLRFSSQTYLFILGAVIVLPLLIFDGSVLFRSYQSEYRRTLEEAEQFASQLDSLITATLQKNLGLLEGLSVSSSLAQDDLRSFYIEAKRLAAVDPQRIILLRDLEGRQFLNTQREFGRDLPPAIPLTVAERNNYLAGRPTVTGVYRSPISGEARFAIAVPLPQKGMILSLTLPTSYIRDVIAKALPPNWIATVGDQNGNMLARSVKHEEVTAKPANSRFLELAEKPRGSFQVTNFEGVELISGYVKSNWSGWIVAANVQNDEIAAPYRRLLLSLVLTALISLCLSILFAFILGRLFARDVNALTEQAAALADNRKVAEADIRLTDLSAVGSALAAASKAIRTKERERDLLTNELNHRVKNTLASIQSIAHNTIRDNKTPGEAREALFQRLSALSRAHDLLTRSSWESAGLDEIVDSVVQAFGGPERVCVESGGNVKLRASTALALSLALHELATNAAKYGALSSTTGLISIAWHFHAGPDAPTVVLKWKETGGSAPSKPSRVGFGTRLIHAAFADIPGASAELSYPSTGVVCRMTIPTAALFLGPRA